ncbi:unnamed protein product [Brugia timori]|uniref:Vesicular, overexpressed in cancer, prosurvival protein 1 n=1 Tax=Brugia timori TaxID=42155 RepID=A0A0R3QS37_9BILA|nr:unnamed protein product [Brugia timori]
MLLTSQTPVAEPTLFVWPHIIIAIFSVSTMVSLLTLCVSTHCCRNTKKKENPYGEIATTPTADVAFSTIVCRNRTNGSQRHHPSRLSSLHTSVNLTHAEFMQSSCCLDSFLYFSASYERSVHRLSAPIPHSSAAVKRALPKLPELSARLENKNASALYSTMGHSMPAVGRNGSFLYGEGPANPTYESIDMDPLYSKANDYFYLTSRNNIIISATSKKERNVLRLVVFALGNGGPSVKRYDYPSFAPQNQIQPIVATDDVLYQSTSQIYAGVSEDPYSSIASHTGGETNYDVGYSHVRESINTEPSRYFANSQGQNRTLDHLYSRVSFIYLYIRRTSTYRPLPSNDFAVEYVSSGSDKTSPSYRYITVRESVDAIRQRLNEFNAPQSVRNDGCGPIREHYYSSIGGSDYETLQISAASPNQPSSDSQVIPSTSCVIHDILPETMSDAISTCENIPPKPPTSPIPLRIAAVREDNLQKKRPLLSGTNDDRCSNISEKIRRLRTNFFDQEFKLLDDLKGPSSTDLRFEQLLGATNQHETSKWINSFQNNPNFDSEHHVDQASSSNFDDTYQHLPKLTTGRSQTHNARNDTWNAHLSTAEHCKTIVQNERSYSSNKADVPGIKQSVKVVTFQQEGNNDEEQCFVFKRRDRLSEQTTNNTNSACFAETSLDKASNNTGENMEMQFCSQQQSVMDLSCGENDSGGGRSVQTASLSFSHESINGNVLNNDDNGNRV